MTRVNRPMIELKDSPLTQGIWAAYAIVLVVNLTTVGTDRPDVAFVSKILLMPLLIAWLIAFVKHHRVAISTTLKLMIVGLVFAWLGDIALTFTGDAFFALGLVCFLIMQSGRFELRTVDDLVFDRHDESRRNSQSQSFGFCEGREVVSGRRNDQLGCGRDGD